MHVVIKRVGSATYIRKKTDLKSKTIIRQITLCKDKVSIPQEGNNYMLLIAGCRNVGELKEERDCTQ